MKCSDLRPVQDLARVQGDDGARGELQAAAAAAGDGVAHLPAVRRVIIRIHS